MYHLVYFSCGTFSFPLDTVDYKNPGKKGEINYDIQTCKVGLILFI